LAGTTFDINTIVYLYTVRKWELLQIAVKMKCSKTTVRNKLTSAGVTIRNIPNAPPTLEEIRQRAAEVRDSWSPREERFRRGESARYEMPTAHDPFLAMNRIY